MTNDICVLGSLVCPKDMATRLSEAVSEMLDADYTATAAFEEPDGSWRVEFYLRDDDDAVRIREIVATAAGDEVSRAIQFEALQARDWISKSLEGLKVVRAGRFAIHGSHDRDKIKANETGIEIEAALAFGTGHHGTTLGCLRALNEIARIHKPKRILDVGAGTAVLAIAAARAFQSPVIATEIDRASVAVAKENVRANRAGALVEVLHTGSLSVPVIAQYGPYDLIFANILLPVLKALSREIASLAAPGANVILSGLLPSQALAALARYQALGFRLRKSETIENWTTLTLRAP
ncbi:MAG: 50S ribosomal protein L11 methyltransferase [Xanthobacteraceae bacterium]|jgi:ribosomal protein L11 methyltransferase